MCPCDVYTFKKRNNPPPGMIDTHLNPRLSTPAQSTHIHTAMPPRQLKPTKPHQPNRLPPHPTIPPPPTPSSNPTKPRNLKSSVRRPRQRALLRTQPIPPKSTTSQRRACKSRTTCPQTRKPKKRKEKKPKDQKKRNKKKPPPKKE